MEQITITNGTGSAQVKQGTYNVSADVNGYENSSINPTSVSIDSQTSAYNFTIEATGTLTLHVTEDGTDTGTPIVGATFYRTDQAGTTYGSIITTDSNGDAIFNNVPFDTNGFTLYYKQTASDGSHDFSDLVQNTSLTESTTTIQITNAPYQTYTFNLTDANYSNMPIESGTITIQ